MLAILAKVFGKRAAAADQGIAAMLEAERAVKALINAKDSAAIRHRLQKSVVVRDERRELFKIAKALPPKHREPMLKAIDALGDVQKAADQILLKEIGRGGEPTAAASGTLGDIERAADDIAGTVRKSDGKPLTREQAMARAIEADPSLYKRYRLQRRRERGYPT